MFVLFCLNLSGFDSRFLAFCLLASCRHVFFSATNCQVEHRVVSQVLGFIGDIKCILLTLCFQKFTRERGLKRTAKSCKDM